MVPKDTLQLLIDTAQKAATPARIEIDDPRTVTYLHGDKLTQINVPPPARAHYVQSLDTLVECAQAQMASLPVIWHKDYGNCGEVRLVLDDNDRRDSVIFHLTWSQEFRRLSELKDSPQLMDQRSFVRLLRITLGLAESQVGVFRRLAWSSGSKAEGDMQHGRDRLGREIQAAASGAEALPEDLLLSVPVYDNLGERDPVQVRCHVEIDLASERLGLIPFAGELQRAIDEAQLSIHSRLVEALSDDVPIYYGRP